MTATCSICGKRWDNQDPGITKWWGTDEWACTDEALCFDRAAMNQLAEGVGNAELR